MLYSFEKATENKKPCSKCEVYYPDNPNFFHRLDRVFPWKGHSSQCKKCKGVATWNLSKERGGDEWREGGIRHLPIRWNVDVVGSLPVFMTASDLAREEREQTIYEAYSKLPESKEKNTLKEAFQFLTEVSL